MSNFAIMRSAKLKGMGGVAASLKHAYRERETPNAEAEKTPDNEQIVSKSVDEAMGKLRQNLPEKRRKDAVLAVEYVMTASPEWWKNADKAKQEAFMQRSMDWLKAKYGEQNIVAAVVHRDETSPHLSAFVTPITQDGRLSAKEFIGNRAKMKRDQTTFADAVKDLGLERGLEGSRARHTSIRQYYARVNAKTPEIGSVELPRGRPFEGYKHYGARVVESIRKEANPVINAMAAKADAYDSEKQRANDATKTAEKNRKALLAASQEMLKLRAVAQDKADKGVKLLSIIEQGGDTLQRLQAKLRNDRRQEQQRSEQQRDQGQDLER
ncbi:TPA: MobV family relaxase [Proteus mirabilis]